jgi:hypothetical protein
MRYDHPFELGLAVRPRSPFLVRDIARPAFIYQFLNHANDAVIMGNLFLKPRPLNMGASSKFRTSSFFAYHSILDDIFFLSPQRGSCHTTRTLPNRVTVFPS